MSDTDDRPTGDASQDDDAAEAQKSKSTEPSLQEHHDPETEADTSSGGAA